MTAPERLGHLALRFVRAQLAARAELVALVGTHIYPDAVPQRGAYPAVVFQLMVADDQIVTGNRKIGAVFDIRVKACSHATSRDEAVGIAREITAALHGAHGLVAGTAVNVVNVQQQREYSQPSLEGGEWFQQEGAEFRVWVDNG